MKIVISVKSIYPFHSYGGVEKYIFNMAKHLVDRGIEVEIVAPIYKLNFKQEFYENIQFTFLYPKISHFLSSSLGRIGEHLFGLSLSSYLSKIDFDLLHGVELTPYIYLHRNNRKPVVSHLFYDTYRKKPYKDKLHLIKAPFVSVFKTGAVKYCIKSSESIITETPLQSQELIDLFEVSEKKILDIPVAIDLNLVNNFKENSKISRRQIGIKENDFVLISVNRLVPEKGIEYLIHALKTIKDNVKQTKLILIGDGYLEQRIISMIKNYELSKNVIHLKNVSEEELYGYYSISDLYVSPTLQDDFIMGIQEAMACGLAIVSTGQKGLVNDNINGYVVEKRNPESIAGKVIEIYTKKSSRTMGKQSKDIIKDYDWNIVIDKLIKIYGKILNK